MKTMYFLKDENTNNFNCGHYEEMVVVEVHVHENGGYVSLYGYVTDISKTSPTVLFSRREDAEREAEKRNEKASRRWHEYLRS